MAEMNLWQWLTHTGLIKGDPTYYSSGKATADEYANALRTAITNLGGASDPTARKALFDRLKAAGAFKGDANYYSNQQASAEELEKLIDVSSTFFDKQPAAAPSTKAPQVSTKPDPLEPGAPKAPVVGTPNGVLAGGKTVRVQQPDKTYRWYQIYEFPPGSNSWVSYQFDNVAQVRASLGDKFGFVNRTPAWMDGNVLAEAAAEEIVGMAGNWNTFIGEVQRDAAVKAGVRDPTLIGKMWSDKEMQKIMAQATVGQWTPEQILAEQRKTKFWTDTLYPGIKAFYGRTQDPERAWVNYEGNVSPALTALGYAKDADGTYNTNIKKMLDSGVDAQIFLENVPVFQQAVQNSQFFDVYRQRAQAELGKDVTFGDWFSVLKGEAAPELMKVAEGATLAYTAQQADFGLDEAMLQRLIAERDLSEQEARNVFSEVNQAVLALGEDGLLRGGLSRDDILSAAAGINPASALSVDEVRLKVAKIAQENDLFDEEKLQFYVGFSPSGTPTRPGLGVLAPEGA